MKTNKFWLVLALGAVLTSLSLTSCQKEPIEEIISSEVLESGLDKNVKESPINNPDGSKGTSLSYESWIMLKVETRASSDRKVSVTLNTALNSFSQDMEVKTFDITSSENSISYKIVEGNKEGYVTIRDSIWVYTVKHDNFSFSYELGNQFAFYDDGITKQKMPHLRIENIIDKGYTITDMDSKVDNYLAYALKKYQHTITVMFNGKSYDIVANIILRKIIGNSREPFIVRSQLIDKRIVKDVYEFTSYVKVKQTWSTGEVSTKEHKIGASGSVATTQMMYVTTQGYPNDLNKVSSNLVGEISKAGSAEGNYIVTYICHQKYLSVYKFIEFEYVVSYIEAIYDDGVLKVVFDTPSFEAFIDGNIRLEKIQDLREDDQGPYEVYMVYHDLTGIMGHITSNCVGSRELKVRL